MRRIYIILLILLAALLLTQFFRPEKNVGTLDSKTDFLQASGIPDTLAAVFLNSCYDCHSDDTRYPWYSNIAPVSWFLNKHIEEGRSQLNFSSWGSLDKAEKISLLDGICEECKAGSMPLRSYLIMHGSARLEPDKIESICDWAESEAMDIITSEQGGDTGI
jgi:hypothetical protein